MTETITLRRLLAAGAASVAVGLTVFAAAVGTGTPPGAAAAPAAIAGLFALIVAPLAALARQVGAEADDHEEIERRIAEGLGLSEAEFEAAFGWGGGEPAAGNQDEDRDSSRSGSSSGSRRPPRQRSAGRPEDSED